MSGKPRTNLLGILRLPSHLPTAFQAGLQIDALGSLPMLLPIPSPQILETLAPNPETLAPKTGNPRPKNTSQVSDLTAESGVYRLINRLKKTIQ